MTTQPDDDSDWDELARELAINTPAAPEPAPPADAGDEFDAAAPAGGDEENDGPEEDADAEGEGDAGQPGDAAPGEGTPGTGRKRRRRRRRRKGGGGQPADAAAVPEEAAEPEAEPVAEEFAEAGDEPPADDGYDGEDAPADEVEPAMSTIEAEEDAGGEMLRDLIANWNVPPWDEIVSGLHRPN